MICWCCVNAAVTNGWLLPDQFVALSEQAYGVAVLEQCRVCCYFLLIGLPLV
jgi:hypothetical protein